MRNEKYGKQTFRTSSIFVLVLSLSVVGFTQDRRPDRGIQPANSYSISDIENVNLTNGNLMLNIPLASLPAGRGLGYTVALNYNSKLWNALQERRTDGIGQNPEDLYYFRELVAASDSGGWFLDSGGYRLKRINRLELEPEAPCMEYSGEAAYRRNGHIFKMELQMPDGGVREFHPYGVGTQAVGYPDGFYNVDPYGVQHQYSYSPPGPYGGHPTCSYSAVQVTTAGINYYTTDGSRLRLFLPYQPGVPFPLMRWTLYQPDGRIVENLPADDPSIAQRMTDRNGNKLVWKPATLNGLNGVKIENEVGQYVFVSWNKIIQPGVSGELLETTLQWDDIWVYKRHLATIAPNANYSFTHAELYQNLGVLEKIILPQQAGGREYLFSYHGDYEPPGTGNYTDGTGELESVTLPSGATAEYSYALDGDPMGVEMNRAITGSKVTGRILTYDLEYDGNSNPVTETTTYGSGPGTGGACSPDGRCEGHVSAIGGSLNGYAYRITQTGGSVVEKLWVARRHMGGSYYNQIEPIVKTEFTSVADATGTPTQTAIKDFEYDQNGNVLEIKEYDWVPFNSVPRSITGEVNEYLPVARVTGLPASGLTMKRKTINTYYNATPNVLAPEPQHANHYSNPSSTRLKNVLKSTEIQDGIGNIVSRSEFSYDDPTNKGNLLETKTWDSTRGAVSNPLTTGTNGNSISTSATYNQYGMPLTTTDANNVVTQITYGNIAGPNGNVTDLYPTEVKSAYNTAIQQTVQSEYDFYTGLATRLTALGNTSAENVVSETIYDALGRPTLSKAAVGTPLEVWTRMEYFDTQRRVVTKADLFVKDDGKKVAIQHFDQLGRVRLARTLEDAATEDPANETDGIKVQTRYSTGNPNSYQLTSNPYRANYPSNETDPTMGWTRSKAWNTGHHAEVETFSGGALPAPWGSNTNSTGKVQTDTDANTTTVTDQAGKQRRSITNALGQLTRVDEPDANGNLGSISAPNQATNYFYNTLGKMVRVQQGVQNRYFMYDSLGRALRVKQPEQEVNTALNTTGNPDNNSWTAGFTFDNNGNVLTTTDAKGTTITSTYDALNRPLTRTHSDGTPTVTNSYDNQTVPFSKGKLTKVTSSISESRYTQFDIAGRLTQYQQITDGNTYTSSYQYNLSGALVEETYPSGRKVRNEFESDGQLSKVESMKGGTTIYRPFVTNIAYNDAGMISQLRYGNGRWETSKFNSRLQLTETGLGASSVDTGLWKNVYEYGELQTNGTVDPLKNSGNIGKQTLSVPGTNFVQSYKYDSVYRLTEAKETTGTTQNWIQQFGYDIYGNRTSFIKTIGGTTTSTTPSIDPNTNRFNLNQGFAYDKNGNVVNDIDSATSLSRQFIFDGDNKQVEVKKNGVTIGRYFYDGEGRRVKKITDAETTIFVYSAGKLIAEYSTQLSSAPSTSYLTNDHLGSPRVITNELGQVKARRDFMPFGEELFVNVGGRTTDLKYGSSTDDVRQKFTGYQKDSETSLDFAEARMYENRFGRFTAIDPLLASGKSANPQTFNRFIYVRNNPIKLVDPSGLCDAPSGLQKGQVGICFEAFIRTKNVPGGPGLGDNRTFAGNDPTATARVTVWAIVSRSEDGEFVLIEKQRRVSPSVVSVATPTEGGFNAAKTGNQSDGTVSLLGSAKTDVTYSNNDVKTTDKGFGKGIDITLSIADGTNGGQQLGRDLQTTGSVMAGTTSPTAGAVVAGAGKVAEAISPAGTIDGNMTVRISGNNQVTLVGGQSKGYPSYAGYAYTKGADEKVVTQTLVQRPENKIEDLTKPMTPFPR